MKRLLWITYSIILITMLQILPVVAQQDYTIICNETDTVIVFDGKWTTDEEWKDSTSISMRFNPTAQDAGLVNNGTVHCLIKHDGENLYALIDSVSSTNPLGNLTAGGWDFYGACIDYNNEKLEYPLKDDLFVSITWMLKNGSYFIINGLDNPTQTGWNYANARKEPVYLKHTISSSPFSRNPHVVCEFVIPLEDMSDEIGFGVIAINFPKKTINTWPENFVDSSPKTWGTVIINKTTEVIKAPISNQTTVPTQNLTTPYSTEEIITPPLSTEEIDKNGVMNIQESLPSQTIYISIIGVVLVVTIVFIARNLLKRKK
jgi:hypothetical protein